MRVEKYERSPQQMDRFVIFGDITKDINRPQSFSRKLRSLALLHFNLSGP